MKAATVVYGKALLTRVGRGLSQPWSVPELARELRDGLAAPFGAKGRGELAPLVGLAARWIDVDPGEVELADSRFDTIDALWRAIAPVEDGPEILANEELLEALAAYVGACHAFVDDEITAGMNEQERALLRDAFPSWCELWFQCNHPKPEIDDGEWRTLEGYRSLFRKVDRARLLAVSDRVARLADPRFLATLGKRLARCVRTKAKVDGFSGDVIAVLDGDDRDRVVLLGPGKTTVTGRAALVIDLGGDDTWKRAAVAADPSALVSVVLELNGNDVYASEEPGPAYAAGGIALLVDAKGKDRYASKRLGQAASSLGFAALLDLEGDDRYEGQDFVQGFSFCGVALLLDRAGDDVYDAWAYAQGAGVGNGFVACVDGGGDDRYVANGHWPDVYGDSGPGSFNGNSQGWSTGIRGGRSDGVKETPIPGGIAALVDLGDGKDYYESGNFSQGGGYYFGFGLMYDDGGNDENHGYRYSQGFGVHQACGIRWDAAGDDTYVTKCAANCGAGWDEGVGWLIDESGDDQYDVGGLALGGTANSAVAVLFDGGGADRYGGGGGADSQGGSGDSSYHDFQAIGALLDLGGGKDSYTRKDRGDDRALTGDWFGVFLDAKEKRVDALLDPKVLKKLLVPPQEKR